MKEKIKKWWIRWDMTWADIVILLVCLVILYFIAKNNEDVFVGILFGLLFGIGLGIVIQQRKDKIKKIHERKN